MGARTGQNTQFSAILKFCKISKTRAQSWHDTNAWSALVQRAISNGELDSNARVDCLLFTVEWMLAHPLTERRRQQCLWLQSTVTMHRSVRYSLKHLVRVRLRRMCSPRDMEALPLPPALIDYCVVSLRCADSFVDGCHVV